MIRSATPVFALMDCFRREVPRPDVDQFEAAGTPQQNPVETIVWAGLVTLLTGALSLRLLGAVGIEGIFSLLLAVPATFVLLHAGIVLFGAVADLTGSMIGAWMVGGSAIAGWLVVSSAQTHLTGWLWLGWMGLNLLAWTALRLWNLFTADSR